jgi:ribosomal protein L22
MNPAMANYVKKRREFNEKAAVDHQGLPTESDVLPGESLFDEFEESRERQLELEAKEKPTGSRQALERRNWETMDPVLNPDPENRVRWERKMVIEQVRKDGRLTKDEMLRRTERQCMSRSAQLKTSTKKLVMLARQVQGMTVSEALLQMRFSKKRIAEEVSKHLEHARNEAVVKWGMGLGKAEGRTGHSVEIQLADGKRKKIKDRTDIYIDQAWVGRGEYEPELEHRARGKVNVLRKPYASKSGLVFPARSDC